MKIKDMVVGQTITTDLVLGECSIRKTKGNPPRDFLAATFTDGEEHLDGKIWNYNAAKGVPELNKVYTIGGTVGEYQGKKQIVLNKMMLSADQSVERFEPTYTEDAAGIYDDCYMMVEAMSPGNLKVITQSVMEQYKYELILGTGAKHVHHVGHGGLIAHTREVAVLASCIADNLCNLGYAVNRDLVTAGALLHDIGKCRTYNITGAVIDMSIVGRTLEHIVAGIEMFDWAVSQRCHALFASKEALALRHIIASHHGELEYGSPTTPAFMEAYIVHYADKISADMSVLNEANCKAVNDGKDLTDKIFVLHNHEHILQKDVL